MKDRVHIVLLHPHFTVAGGAGTYALQVSALLAERGYRVTIVCICAEHNLVREYESHIDFTSLGGPLSSSIFHWLLLPFFLFKMTRCVNKLQPDVLFPQVFPANWWGFFYRMLHPRTPTIWMCQEPSAFIHNRTWIAALPPSFIKLCVWGLNPLLKVIDLWLSRKVDRVLANSEYTKRYAQQVYGHLAEKIHVTHLGVDHTRFSPPPSQKTRRKQFITVGRLSRFKNVDCIIDALKELERRGDTESELIVVGRGEDEQRLSAYAKEKGLAGRVRFMGHVADAELVELLQNSRASVLASVDEPFGLVVVEAMACGTPAIVVASGGPSETVLHERSGYHVPAKDSIAIADRLEVLLSNDAIFNGLSQGAVERAQQYRWEVCCTEFENHMTELLGFDSTQSSNSDREVAHG